MVFVSTLAVSRDIQQLERRSLPERIAVVDHLIRSPIEPELLAHLPLRQPRGQLAQIDPMRLPQTDERGETAECVPSMCLRPRLRPDSALESLARRNLVYNSV